MNIPILAQNKKDVLLYNNVITCPFCLTELENNSSDIGQAKCNCCGRSFTYEKFDEDYQIIGKIGKLKMIAAYTETGIYGTANTAKGAIRDAYLQKKGKNNYKTGEMSPYLASYVDLYGGDIGFSDRENDGILRYITEEGDLI